MTTYNELKGFKGDIRISNLSLALVEEFDDHMREVNGDSAGGCNPYYIVLRTIILDM